MRKPIRATVCFAALILVSLVLSSCGFVFITESFDDRREVSLADTYTASRITAPEVPVNGSERAEYDPGSGLVSLPDYDFDGGNFIVVTPDDSVLFPDESGELFSEAAKKMRAAVAEKFSFRFYHQTPGESDIVEYIDSVTVGDYYADLMILPYSEVEELKAAGKITAFDDKAFFVAESEYFDSDIMSLMNGDDRIYAVYSDSVRDLRDSYCLFFRHDSADKTKLYNAAKEGKLTWSALLSEVKSGGIVCFDGGETLVDRYLPDNERVIDSDDPCLSFISGEASVMVAPISEIEKLSGMGQAFGILPLPKQDVDGEYIGYFGGLLNMDVFVCPVNSASPELTVLVMNSLCLTASELYKAEAVDYYADYIRDEASYGMLDLIFSPERIED